MATPTYEELQREKRRCLGVTETRETLVLGEEVNSDPIRRFREDFGYVLVLLML
jgi:hypothetical protein